MLARRSACLFRTLDAEGFHAGTEGGGVHPQQLGGAALAGDAPLGGFKGEYDVLAFDGLEFVNGQHGRVAGFGR